MSICQCMSCITEYEFLLFLSLVCSSHINNTMNNIIHIAVDDGLNINMLNYLIDNLIEPLPNDLFPQQRRARVRNENYYEITIPTYTDDLFSEHFRMSRITFQALVNVVGNNAHDQINIEIPLEKKLLVTIWVLGKPESFLAAGDRFNIAKSSGHGIFKYIIHIITSLMPQYIRWPNHVQRAVSSEIFLARSRGIPNVVGAIDGCHIPIKQPPGNAMDYYNRKQHYSIILQGVCDHSRRFIDVFIGQPGRMHDSTVFRNSPLFQALMNRQHSLLLQQEHLIGDSAYSLMMNLMTPYRDNGHLLPFHTTYNNRLSKIRNIIERAFGFMKVKWRRLKYLDVSDLYLANEIVASACVLQNFLLDQGEEDYDEMDIDDNDDDDYPAMYDNEMDDRYQIVQAVTKLNNIAAAL